MSHLISLISSLSLIISPLCFGQVSVLTYHNDNMRTGANLAETQLSTSSVSANTFGMLFSYPVDASIYAQPLYVPLVNIPGKGVHNVVYVATMNDSVYAFDADSNTASNAAPLWHVNFTNPAVGITAVNSANIETATNVSGPLGIMGTPVIDGSSGTLYLVARTVESGSYVQRLHALDIASGTEKFGGPVMIQASIAGSGYDSVNGVVSFNPMTANQRAALALTNGDVVIAWGALDGDFDPYHGWVMAYSATTLQQVSVYNSTPNGSRGGFWQSGTGMPIDAGGNVYVTSGNGDWDGVKNLGDTMVKLNVANGLSPTDWFTPDDQSNLSLNDLDLGVSGPILLPSTNLLLGGSKQGILYLLNTNKMGHLVSGNGQIVQSVQATSAEIHSSAYYNSPTLGPLFYLWTAGDFFKAFQFNGSTLGTTPFMESSFTAPAGNPGGVLSISANGSQAGSGIVWVSMPLDADAELQVVPGVLRAFDASNLQNELWDSNQNTARDNVGDFAKFCPPTVANGKVYLATFSNALDVYGLINSNPDFTVNVTPGTEVIGLNVGSGAYTVSVSDLNGFAGTVMLSIAGLPTGASAAFGPTSVSGNGTSTLTVNLSSATPAGTYLLAVTGTSGSLSHSVNVGLTVTAAAGELLGSLTAPSGAPNLTSVGTSDWAHWGLTSASSFDHKATGGGEISNYTLVGAGSVLNFGNNPVGFTWTDGTPTPSTTDSTTGIYVAGQGNGFQITAPADTTKRTLSVYVGVWESQGQMVAHLSDGSAADYVDTTLNNASGTTPGLYTFTYQAVSSGQTLTVTFTQFNNTSGNVTLQAATLAGATVSPDFTLSASPSSDTVALGGSGSYTVTVGALNGFNGSVGLSVSGLPTGATAAFTPATVTGSGTSNLAVTVGTSTAAGTYALTVAGSSGSLSHTTAVSLVVTSGGVAGVLTGALTTPSGAPNLTSVGTSDWAHWGLTSASSFDHKATGGGEISNYTLVGAGSVLNFGNNPVGFTWTDGTPTPSTTDSTTGIYVAGQGNGFQITAPADTTKRTLSVYVGVWESQGQMVAHLSDGSAADYVDTTLNNASGTTPGLYTFTYQAVSSGQTLTVTFTQFNNTSGNVTLQAATLANAP